MIGVEPAADSDIVGATGRNRCTTDVGPETLNVSSGAQTVDQCHPEKTTPSQQADTAPHTIKLHS